MDEQGATTLRDVLRNVAGITFQAGEGGVPAGDQLSIRGFSARTDMFIDGVRDFGGYSRDSFNMEQVEVAKGPTSSLAGRGVDRRRDQPGQQGAGPDADRRSHHRRRQRELSAHHARFQPAADGTAHSGIVIPRQRDVDRYRRAESRSRGVVQDGAWHRHSGSAAAPTREPRSAISSCSRTTCRSTACPGCRPTPIRSCRPTRTASRRSISRTSTAWSIATTRIPTPTWRPSMWPATSARPPRVRNLTRWGRNVRDSVITAPRFAAVNTSTAINRQLQSRDMTDTILANQTNLTTRLSTGAVGHAIVAGAEFSSEQSVNFARTGPTAPTADLYHPNPNDPYPGPIVRSGAKTDGTANSAAAYLFDTATIGSHLELTGGLRWDRFDVDYVSTAVTGVATPFERTDTMTSGRAGVDLQAAPAGQHLRRFRDVVQSLGRGPVAGRGERGARAREDAQPRGRHEVGPVQPAAVRDRGVVPYRQDQRPDAGRESRRSADRAGRRAARVGHRVRGVRPAPSLVDGDRQLRAHAQHHRGFEYRGGTESESRADAGAHAIAVVDVRSAWRRWRSAAARSTWTASSATPPTPPACRAIG